MTVKLGVSVASNGFLIVLTAFSCPGIPGCPAMQYVVELLLTDGHDGLHQCSSIDLTLAPVQSELSFKN